MSKKPGKTTAKSTVRKRRQPHGGALNAGGTKGNKGGPGRPPSAIRELCAGAFADRIPVLEQIADGHAIQRVKMGGQETEAMMSADVGERIKAIDLLGKYGGLQKVEHAGTLGIERLLEEVEQLGDDDE